jgi:hypothetical protein
VGLLGRDQSLSRADEANGGPTGSIASPAGRYIGGVANASAGYPVPPAGYSGKFRSCRFLESSLTKRRLLPITLSAVWTALSRLLRSLLAGSLCRLLVRPEPGRRGSGVPLRWRVVVVLLPASPAIWRAPTVMMMMTLQEERRRQHKGVIGPVPVEVVGSFSCRMLQPFPVTEVARVANLGRCFGRVYDVDSAYEVSRIRGH